MTTPEEVLAELRRYTLRHPIFGSVKIRYEWDEFDPHYVKIFVSSKVPDRETGEPIDIYTNQNIHVDLPSLDYVGVSVRAALRSHLLHELDEMLLLDGKVWDDPHNRKVRT